MIIKKPFRLIKYLPRQEEICGFGDNLFYAKDILKQTSPEQA